MCYDYLSIEKNKEKVSINRLIKRNICLSKSTFQCFGLVISLPHKKPKIITIEGTINNKNIPWIRALDPKPSSI